MEANRERNSMRALRAADAALPRPGAQRCRARGGGGAPRPLLVLPKAVPLRGAPPAVRPSGGRGADAARAQAEARRASHTAAVALLPRTARRPDDHVQLAGAGAAG